MNCSIRPAACAALALAALFPVAAQEPRETLTPNFAQAIPSIPGKTLMAVGS
jgi:hypothetical protein